MSKDKKTYKLESEKQFWDIVVEWETTTISYGKKGCKGRKCPTKWHDSHAKAIQFARRHVNAKIIQGFEDVSEPSKAPKLFKLPSIGRRPSLKKAISKHIKTNVKTAWKNAPKKRESIRKLARQDTVTLGSPSEDPPTLYRVSPLKTQKTIAGGPPILSRAKSKKSVKKQQSQRKWRKPPKKQSTIRRKAESENL